MKKRFCIAFFLPIVILLAAQFLFIDLHSKDFLQFYSKNMRSDLFSALLTLCAILYSLKTFIIVEIKKNVYDDNRYEKRVKEQKKLNPKTPNKYVPLRRLGDLLFYSVMGLLFAAVVQFSFGFIPSWWAAVFSLYVALCSLALFAVSLVEIRNNLNVWFAFIDED